MADSGKIPCLRRKSACGGLSRSFAQKSGGSVREPPDTVVSFPISLPASAHECATCHSQAARLA